jgi:hypothetical protein
MTFSTLKWPWEKFKPQVENETETFWVNADLMTPMKINVLM